MHLTIFDLDNTLLTTNISFKFYLYLYKKKIDKSSIFKLIYYFLKFKYFNMNIEDLHQVVFEKFLKGKKYTLFAKEIDRFLDKYLADLFYLPAVLELQRAMYEKHFIVIFSASAFFLVEPISKILKVDEYRASEYLFDKDERFEKIKCVMSGERKAKEAIDLIKRLNITKKDVSVYSDSIRDLKLFELAEKKVCVSPCKKLLRLSKKRNWQVI